MSAPFATLECKTFRTRPVPKNLVFFTSHALRQSCDKFPPLRAVRDTIGPDEYVRRLTACAGQAVDSGKPTVILGNKFFVGAFWDSASRTATPIAFAAVPDDVKPGYWSIRTCLTIPEITGNGNCAK